MGGGDLKMVIIRKLLSIILILIIPNIVSARSYDIFIQNIDDKNWEIAKVQSNKLKDPQLKVLVQWLELLNEKNPNFYNLSAFIKAHPSWPNINILRQKIEESDFKNCKEQDILAWFKAYPPQSNIGKKKYISLLGNGEVKTKYIKEIWHEGDFSSLEQNKFLAQYGNVLDAKDHKIRIDYLLFNDKADQAFRQLPNISSQLKNLYLTKIQMQQRKSYKVEHDYYKDLGFLYNMASIYETKDNEEGVIKTLAAASLIKNKNQQYLWKMKVKFIRPLIQKGSYYTAYLFASTHGNVSAKEYSEAEWLAGWIALQFLNKPQLAVTHFTNMYNKVKLPISLSRGSYWLARSYEKLGKNQDAQIWYETAAKHYTTFYGQIATCKTNNCEVNLNQDPIITAEDKKHFNNNSFVKIALILHQSKYKYYVQKFIYKAIDNSKALGEVALITRLGFELNHDHLSVEAAKHASYQDIHIIHSNYPILKDIYKNHELDQALIMSLIRQESVCNHKAVSSAGALGLMQLMPHVAKATAATIPVSYKKDKLTSDPHFNTMLGVHHLKLLLNKYDNYYPLSIAAYNAGDKPAKKWIEDNGDPRSMKNIEEVVDWIEKISFYETRNYVQRVLEGKSIYHLLMTKEKTLPIIKDLVPEKN